MMKKTVAVGIALGLMAAAPAMADEALAKSKGCMACHQVDKQIIGPSYNDVSARYKDQADAVDVLMASVKDGSTGKWKDKGVMAPMIPHPTLSDEDNRKLVDWILNH